MEETFRKGADCKAGEEVVQVCEGAAVNDSSSSTIVSRLIVQTVQQQQQKKKYNLHLYTYYHTDLKNMTSFPKECEKECGMCHHIFATCVPWDDRITYFTSRNEMPRLTATNNPSMYISNY